MSRNSTTDHFVSAEFGPINGGRPVYLTSKSPSVPNLNETFTEDFKKRLSPERAQSQLNTTSVAEESTNVSLIDLYGGEEDDDEELEQAARNSDVPRSSTNSASADSPRRPSVGKDLSEYDRYGFKKHNAHVSQEEYHEWWDEYSRYCIRRKRKWQDLLEKSGLGSDNDVPDRFPPRSEKLKRYVRKGIPAEWRGQAWWHFARGQEKLNKNKGLYDQLLTNFNERNDKSSGRDLEVIERDLHRTFPENIHFQRQPTDNEEPLMIQSLRRVLLAFSVYNPKIGYCQSMNFLAGLLLLFLDEEKTFWMLVIITSRYLPGVHNVNLEGVNVDQGVLMLCVKEYLPEFWHRIVSKQQSRNNEFLYKLPPITLCTASWFMSCFVGIVPIETTLRIWDCLFYEESHILFKVSLSILRICEQELGIARQNHRVLRNKAPSKDDEDIEIFQVLQTVPKKLLDPQNIFDRIIFKRRISLNNLNQEEIDRCRKYVTSQRLKLKNYADIMGNRPSATGGAKRDLTMGPEFVENALSSEVYGFRRSLTAAHWNNSIKEKVRQIRRK
ncbi:LANO_0H01090g1_1 [Lachancea nothofagi CBS 11611]|uniref:LANO_0H01090g1_1 n=1 Tax=Lachancea nothofagi CBS 11611 TaxID=1266666 RepID=A0A1G4KKT1_9SACH|nr:LANO_0H01090g1_1 [Lachancea nothofagi CBS 11611]